MKTINCFLFLLISTSFLAQEGVMPLVENPYIIGQKKEINTKANPGTFDSTFIYTTDTLTLPILDDFSKKRIQKYDANYTDPDVTFDKEYRLLDLSGTPLPTDAEYTQQETFRSTYNADTDETTTTSLATTSIQIGDLSSYPVVYTTTDVYPPYYIYDTINNGTNPSDTIFIVGPQVYQDSATQFFAHATGAESYWLDSFAYHNYRYAIDPWSIGVMTFDGLDETGFPYQIETNITDYADYLTSKPIDMSGAIPADSLYLTFLYQETGFGDPVEESDSLVLEFYEPVSGQWIHQWSANGNLDASSMYLTHIPITNSIYFSDAFQFRFKNYGHLSGSLDHWNLDYVKLRDFSGYQDTLIEDFAMVYPVNSLLQDYTSVPWDHYKNNATGKMGTAVNVSIRNSYFNGGSSISSAGGGEININYAGAQEGSVFLDGQTLANFSETGNPDYLPRTTYHSEHDVSSYSYDTGKTGDLQRFEIEAVVSVPVGSNYLENDTVRTEQLFRNHYAYDDGSAEQAYGPQGTQSKLAIQYTAYEADSILAVDIHFVPTVEDVTNYLFQITIWDDNGGEPGDILYQDDAFFARTPKYTSSQNVFARYYLKDTMKVAVPETFYVGWNQIDAPRLGVGLDKNIDNKQHTFYTIESSTIWNASGIDGSVMLHPVFSTALDAQLGIEQKNKRAKRTIYPNPSSGIFHIKQRENATNESFSVYNLQGKCILKNIGAQIDLSNQPNGIYLLKFNDTPSVTYKIVKH